MERNKPTRLLFFALVVWTAAMKAAETLSLGAGAQAGASSCEQHDALVVWWEEEVRVFRGNGAAAEPACLVDKCLASHRSLSRSFSTSPSSPLFLSISGQRCP